MSTPHWSHFTSIKPQVVRDGGFRIDLRSDLFPPLKGFALSLLNLEPKGVREPHWHSNANELSYCLEGKGLITIFAPFSGHETFTVSAGDAVFIPQNFLHHIENSGNTPLKMLLSFDHEKADSNEISSGFQQMTSYVLGAVYQQMPSFFTPLQKNQEPAVICIQSQPTQPTYPSIPNRYKFNLGDSPPPIQTKGGWVKITNRGTLPTLSGLAVYTLLLNEQAIREPHWHPNSSELNYVVHGNVRISLIFPGGVKQTFNLGPGDISLIPKGYLHDIENIGDGEAFLVVFFNHEYPSDIGLSGAAGAYSNSVLSSLFGVPPDYFEGFPKYQSDLKIVSGGG